MTCGSTYSIWEQNLAGAGRSEAWSLDGITPEQGARSLDGERLDEPLPELRLGKIQPGKLADLVVAPIEWIVPERIRAIVERAGATVQFAPTTIEGKREHYDFANFLDKVACLDTTASKMKRAASGAIRGISRLVLRPIPEDASPVFRITEFPLIVLVRDDVRRQLEASCDGPSHFVPPDKYRY